MNDRHQKGRKNIGSYFYADNLFIGIRTGKLISILFPVIFFSFDQHTISGWNIQIILNDEFDIISR